MIHLIELTTLLLLNSLVCLGAYLTFQKGMLLEVVDAFAWVYLKPIYPALCGCITCMASIWSIPYWYYHSNLIEWVGYAFALAATNTILYRTFLDDNS